MTFKDDVDAADKRYWRDAREERMTDILEACVNKIDELERDLETANKLIMNLAEQIVHAEEQIGIDDESVTEDDDTTILDLITDQQDSIDDSEAEIDVLRENIESLQKQINKDPEL